MTEVDKNILEQSEGKLFVCIWVNSIAGKTFFAHKDWYTVKDGIIYICNDGELYPTGDKPLSLVTDCNRVGVFDPGRTYKSTMREFSYRDFKKLLKL